MKLFPFPKSLNLFLLGFLVSFIMLNFTNCPDKVAGPNDEKPTGIETTELKAFSKRAENAFLSGNRDSVFAITYEGFAKVAKEYVPNDPELLKKFGESLTNKKLIYAGSMYAEYEITLDGKTYTIAFGQSGDGIWKIVRF